MEKYIWNYIQKRKHKELYLEEKIVRNTQRKQI